MLITRILTAVVMLQEIVVMNHIREKNYNYSDVHLYNDRQNGKGRYSSQKTL